MKDMTGMWILTENAPILIVLQLAQIKRMQIKKYFTNSKKKTLKIYKQVYQWQWIKSMQKIFWGKGENSNSGLFNQKKHSFKLTSCYWFKCLSRPDKHQNQNNYTLWFIIAIKLNCRTENQTKIKDFILFFQTFPDWNLIIRPNYLSLEVVFIENLWDKMSIRNPEFKTKYSTFVNPHAFFFLEKKTITN